MGQTDKEIIEDAKQYLKTRNFKIALMGLSEAVGGAMGYYLWFIDLI